MTILFAACANTDRAKPNKNFSASLKEMQIGNSDFYISLPNSYFIQETKIKDLTIYNLLPIDSLSQLNFTGGLYFGNSSLEFKPEGDSCQASTSHIDVLNESVNWTTYKCGSDYYIQTIIDTVDGNKLKENIHAFGYAKSQTNLQKLFDLFCTLKRKDK